MDDLFLAIERAPEFNPKLGKELDEVLKSSLMLSALGEVYRQARDRVSLLECDLSTPEGLMAAQTAQGNAKGMIQAIEVLITLSQKE